MATVKQLMRLLDEIRSEEYQRGWNDGVASLVEAARRGVPAPELPLDAMPQAQPQPREDDPSIIDLVYQGVKNRPGRKGHLILKDVANQTGIEFKKVDRTGRTSLSRLKKRGKIYQRGIKWYPAEEAEMT